MIFDDLCEPSFTLLTMISIEKLILDTMIIDRQHRTY